LDGLYQKKAIYRFTRLGEVVSRTSKLSSLLSPVEETVGFNCRIKSSGFFNSCHHIYSQKPKVSLLSVIPNNDGIDEFFAELPFLC
jgi:hypothetical protein